MSAEAQAPAPTTTPDPQRDAAAIPGALGRVLSVVRRLIDYGRQLAATARQRAATPGFAVFAKPFGTADLAVILARIANGLRRAAALDATLCRRAARGQNVTPSPVRARPASGPRPARQVAPPDAPPAPRPTAHAEDPRLARLPTEQEIAAAVRRRPVGAVIADICRDLGIMPGQLDRAFWDELSHAIIAYGGSLAGLLRDQRRRVFARGSGDHSGRAGPGSPAPPSRSPAPATGPP
jgi:hypothetical protein